MLFEYAVEPQAIGSSWRNFQLLLSLFGSERGRLIAHYPRAWFKDVYRASAALKPVDRKRLEESLNLAKRSKFIPSTRNYDQALGGWLPNAIAQQAVAPFRAIIAEQNPTRNAHVLTVDEVDENHPLLVAPAVLDVERVGATLAGALKPLISVSKRVLFVDRYFNIRDERYKETLTAFLDECRSSGSPDTRFEIHFCDHDKRPPLEYVVSEAKAWIATRLSIDMSLVFFTWKEKYGGADFHARYFLTDVGGVNVESGFSSEGAHQMVQLSLLTFDVFQSRLSAVERQSTVYELVEPVLEIRPDGSVHQV